MKKIAAILLLFIYSFNLFGYRLVFLFAEQQATENLRVALDKEQYKNEDLLTLRVPLLLPYQTDQKDFERVDGEIIWNGKIYKYVKRKVEKGELVLVCLPDPAKMKIESARDEFFKLANDLQQNKSSKKSGSDTTDAFKNLLAQYDWQSADWDCTFGAFKINYLLQNDIYKLPSNPNSSPEQPPESSIA